jgi:hypothetical protein
LSDSVVAFVDGRSAERGKSLSLAMWVSAQSAPPTAGAQLAAAKPQQPGQ